MLAREGEHQAHDCELRVDELARSHDAVHLFDLPFRSSIYRVFLFPGNLQVDLSFTPASEFGAYGPKFTLLFGAAVERPHVVPAPARDLFGIGVHHAVRAHVAIERGRHWQAVHWIDGVRDQALALACRGRGLESAHARGADALPEGVREAFVETLARHVAIDELRRALTAAVDALLFHADEVRDLADRLDASLRELGAPPGRSAGL